MSTPSPVAAGVAAPVLHPARRVLGAVVRIVVLAAAALATLVAIVPALVGGRALTVQSGSMEPALPVGSVAVVKPIDPAQVKAGDVLHFTDRDATTGQSRIVTHRVVEVLPGPAFVTRGDADPANDPHPVAAADVHGALWYDVPYLGTLWERLATPAGLAILGGVVLLGVVLALRARK